MDNIMNDLNVLSNLLSIISFLLLILVTVFGWIGSRVHNRLDDISKSLGAIERDLRGELSNVDRRVSRLEGSLHSHRREEDRD